MTEPEVLYERWSGHRPESVTAIANSGSNRAYYRLTGVGGSVIGVKGECLDENRAFLYLAEWFRSKGIRTPRILAVSDDSLSYLTEDFGDTSLFGLLASDRERAMELARATLRELPRIQFEGAKGLDFGRCYPVPALDGRGVMWDLNYFKYDFLKPSGAPFDEAGLEDDFERLRDTLLRPGWSAFMYRDFQSRNIMIQDGQPCFIDFQGGREGPCLYDAASFIYQARAGFSPAEQADLEDVYYQALQPYLPCRREAYDEALAPVILFRMLQTLGAYGLRGLVEHKAHFTRSVPTAIRQLKRFTESRSVLQAYPALRDALNAMSERFPQPDPDDARLTIDVFSFSYMKGLPVDYSGNGGGYVFDCRAIHNPGKYDEYKSLTGLDAPVREFLEKDGEILTFLQHAKALADASAARYARRGFTHLQFGFGCTGGRHRSVYGAQHLAEYLAAQGYRVRLTHREQHIQRIFNA